MGHGINYRHRLPASSPTFLIWRKICSTPADTHGKLDVKGAPAHIPRYPTDSAMHIQDRTGLSSINAKTISIYNGLANSTNL